MTKERRRNQLTIRIPLRIRAALDAKAEGERRSVADIINHILEQHFPTKDQERRR